MIHRVAFVDYFVTADIASLSPRPSDEQMPGYDEKIDVWKVPYVVEYLLFHESMLGRTLIAAHVV